jgi:hypothetical protein
MTNLEIIALLIVVPFLILSAGVYITALRLNEQLKQIEKANQKAKKELCRVYRIYKESKKDEK